MGRFQSGHEQTKDATEVSIYGVGMSIIYDLLTERFL